MQHLILVRHGQSDQHVKNLTGGWSDMHLTALGHQQADATAQCLKALLGGQVPQLLSSDLSRARETTEVIAAALGVPPAFHAELREFNNGSAAGLTLDAAKAIELPITYPTVDWIPYKGAESWRTMTDRVTGFLEDIQNATADTTIIVSHANAGVAIVHWWLRLALDAKISYELEPCSITRLGINVWGERTIIKLNDTAHLRTIGLQESSSNHEREFATALDMVQERFGRAMKKSAQRQPFGNGA